MGRARVADIITVAAKLSGMSVDAIMGPGRHRKLAYVRHAVYYVARSNGHSYPQIGARLNRDHSSVIHGLDRAMARAERDPEYAAFLFELTSEAALAPPFVPLPEKIAVLIPDLPETPKLPRPKKSAPAPVVIPAHQYFKRNVKPKNDFGDDQFVVGRARA